MEFQKLTDAEETIGKLIVDAAFKVHSALGPGCLKEFMKCVLFMN